MRKRRAALAAAVTVGGLAGLAAPAEAARPATGSCPRGFDVGPVARADYTSLPRSAAAIDAGLVDEATLLASFDSFDKNADEVVCVQLSHGFEVNNRPVGQYLYNVVDDTSAAGG